MIEEYFGIQLGNAVTFGLPLKNIEQVERFSYEKISAIPGMPNYWTGITNYNGSLLWVLNVDLFLGIVSLDGENFQQKNRFNSHRELTVVILNFWVQGTQRRCALIVEKLLGLMAVEENNLQLLSGEFLENFSGLCKAVFFYEDKPFFLLDLEKFFQEIYQKKDTKVS